MHIIGRAIGRSTSIQLASLKLSFSLYSLILPSLILGKVCGILSYFIHTPYTYVYFSV